MHQQFSLERQSAPNLQKYSQAHPKHKFSWAELVLISALKRTPDAARLDHLDKSLLGQIIFLRQNIFLGQNIFLWQSWTKVSSDISLLGQKSPWTKYFPWTKLDKSLLGKKSPWTKGSLDKCILWQKSTWIKVLLDNCPIGQMSPWTMCTWTKVSLD